MVTDVQLQPHVKKRHRSNACILGLAPMLAAFPMFNCPSPTPPPNFQIHEEPNRQHGSLARYGQELSTP